MGWRPWSKLAAYTVVAAQCAPLSAFDREYSHVYSWNYSMPYNTAELPRLYSYPTSYVGRATQNFNKPGANREVIDRPGRDYVSYLPESYRVKSYNRTVAKTH